MNSKQPRVLVLPWWLRRLRRPQLPGVDRFSSKGPAEAHKRIAALQGVAAVTSCESTIRELVSTMYQRNWADSANALSALNDPGSALRHSPVPLERLGRKGARSAGRIEPSRWGRSASVRCDLLKESQRLRLVHN